MGEILVEIMRPKSGMQLYDTGEFLGPYPSGAPAIFIDTVARMGHSAAIIGGVASDDFGKCVLDRLSRDGVDVDNVLREVSGATAVAFVTYFEDGSRKFIFHLEGTSAVRPVCPAPGIIDSPRFLHIMGCSLTANEGFAGEILKAVDLFTAKGSKLSFDPNVRPELMHGDELQRVIVPLVNRCSILFPGVEELKSITQLDDIPSAVQKLWRTSQIEIIALKRGSSGCTIFTRDASFDVEAYTIETVDPTGAGDCFDAAFLCGILEGRDLGSCARMAAAAGALNAMAMGPMEGDISPENVRKVIETESTA